MNIDNDRPKVRVTKRAYRAAWTIRELWLAKFDPKDSWANREAKQAYQDALEAMKREGLINDYDLFEGIW